MSSQAETRAPSEVPSEDSRQDREGGEVSPFRRYPVRHLIGRLWLRFFGWEVDGGAPPVKKAVVVCYPHTSNWDLPFTLAVAWSVGLEMSWLGKESLFRPPFGRFFKALGGVPIRRSSRQNSVAAVVEALRESDELMLVLAPEGTRKRTAHWKTGFYYMALGAQVPLVLAYLDYPRKRGGLAQVIHPTGDIQRDFEALRAFFQDKQGKFPQNQGPVRLPPSPPADAGTPLDSSPAPA